jgi:enoyl-CoA hydratase
MALTDETATGTELGVVCTQIGALGHVLLDRPHKLNALTSRMRHEITRHYQRWAVDPMIYAIVIEGRGRAFCAGGDVAEMAELAARGLDLAVANAADEFAANWRLNRLVRPHVALIDGHVIGSGVGLSQYGTHRVAAERYAWSMPEVRAGYFPDCGVSFVLSRLPDGIGLYLALTGRRVHAGDAWRLGLATHCIEAGRFGEIKQALTDAQPVDPLLDGLHRDPGPGEIETWRRAIRRCFTAGSLGEVLARLRDSPGAEKAWAEAVLADIGRASPFSLAVTCRLLREAAATDLREALIRDVRLAARFYTHHDFKAGFQALLEGRKAPPDWQPARVEDVTEAEIDACFRPLESGDLQLEPMAIGPSGLA